MPIEPVKQNCTRGIVLISSSTHNAKHSLWNLLDWIGFVLFFVLYFQFTRLNASLLDTSCNNGAYMCTDMGFHDDWEQFTRTDRIKFILSVRSTPFFSHLRLAH